MKFARRMLNMLLHAWPQKLGALVLAVLIWVFVTVNDTSITQRSLFVPINVEGLQPDSVATGLPDFVEITVAGPSSQIDRLRPDNFEAILDLSGEGGAFEVPIRVLSPQGVDLRRVNPSDVIGSIEAVVEKAVPLDAVIMGSIPADMSVSAVAEPGEVTARARSSTLARVVRVVAPVRPSPGERTATPFAVDTAGLPVDGVRIEPETVQVTVSEQPVLVARSLPIELEIPSATGYTVTGRLEEPEVELVGPASVLDGMDQVQGTVALPTDELEDGGYTLPVTLELPDGVHAVGPPPTATVRLSRPRLRE